MKETAFKASIKGKEEHNESRHISKEEDEVNFVKKLQRGSKRFRGMLPFKCFSCGKVGHYAARFSHKDKFEKGKEYAKGNRKQVVNKRIYYTHEDSDGLSNSDESIANYLLRIDEIVNCMKNLGEEIKEVVLVEKVLRSLSTKFEPKCLP